MIPTIKYSLGIYLKRVDGVQIEKAQNDVFIKLHQIGESRFKSETNIGAIFSLDELQVHKVIMRTLFSIGGINKRLCEMIAFNALSGFKYDDIPIYDNKIKHIITDKCPDIIHEQFGRIVTIGGLPPFEGVGTFYKFDLDRFLKIRESSECKEFRKCMTDTQYLSN